MILDTSIRMSIVERVSSTLTQSCFGSAVLLRGSLAKQQADQYSDIDLLWEVPDTHFSRLTDPETLHALLAHVHPLDSLRFDPDLLHSEKRRLAFARFAHLPLFWRLDLDIMARSLHWDFTYDCDNPLARGHQWSRTESALANVVTAIKAHVRGNDEQAYALLQRAYQRVDRSFPPFPLPHLLLNLPEYVSHIDPATLHFARQIQLLVTQVIEEES